MEFTFLTTSHFGKSIQELLYNSDLRHGLEFDTISKLYLTDVQGSP